MNDRVLRIVSETVGGGPILRAHVIERLAVDLGPEEAARVVRELLENGVLDPVTVCRFRASDGRVVMEAGIVRGAHFHMPVPVPMPVAV